jgi:hypothetical protein
VARLHQHQSKHRAGTRMRFWRELYAQTRQVQDFKGQFQGIEHRILVCSLWQPT